MREGLGSVYPSYTNGEKDRAVCRPSRLHGIHDGYDPKQQAAKMADVYGIEKRWAGVYENCRDNGDFATKRSKVCCRLYNTLWFIRDEELRPTMVERA